MLRIIWIYTIFAADPTLNVLYLSYPVSWIVTTLVHVLCAALLIRQLYRKKNRAVAQQMPALELDTQ